MKEIPHYLNMRYQNSSSGLWIHEDIYKSEFIKRHLTKTLFNCSNGILIMSLFLVCSKPLILSKAYADNNSTATIENSQSKYNAGAIEQTEGEEQPLLTNYIDTDTENEPDELIADIYVDEDVVIDSSDATQDLIPADTEDEPEEIISVIETLTVPNWVSGCKSYNITHMDYRAVTDKTSKQYNLLNSAKATTDSSTGLRMIDDRIAIALGLGFNVSVGDYVNVIFENGYEFECIIGDIKDNKDTDNTHRFQKYDGSVVEAITDRHIFTGTKDYPEGFKGTIAQIVRLDKTFEY